MTDPARLLDDAFADACRLAAPGGGRVTSTALRRGFRAEARFPDQRVAVTHPRAEVAMARLAACLRALAAERRAHVAALVGEGGVGQ